MAAEDMMIHRADQTAVPLFTLQARDWEPLAYFIVDGGELFDDLMHELRTLFRIPIAPANLDSIAVTTLTVSLITKLYERVYPGRSISSGATTRIQAAITAAGATVPALITMLADKELELDVQVQEVRIIGRRRLRKTG